MFFKKMSIWNTLEARDTTERLYFQYSSVTEGHVNEFLNWDSNHINGEERYCVYC